jgi:hypothetical protein
MKTNLLFAGALLFASSFSSFSSFSQNSSEFRISKWNQKIEKIKSNVSTNSELKSNRSNNFIPERMERDYWTGTNWEKSGKTDYEYILSNVLNRKINSYWNGASYEISDRQTFTYSPNNTTETVHESYNGTNWSISNKVIEIKDNNGNTIDYRYFDYVSNSFVLNYGNQQIYTYDNQNRVSSIVSINYDNFTSTWIDEMRLVMNYQGAALTPNEVVIEENNGSGILEIQGKVIDIVWHNFSTLDLAYGITQIYDASTSSYSNAYKEITTYNSAGLDLIYLEEVWSGNTWLNDYKSEKTYDNQNNLINRKSFIWDGNNWELDYEEGANYTYNTNNLPSVIVFLYDYFDGNGLVNVTRETYTYKNVTSSKLENVNSAKIYPNPFKDEIRFDLDEESAVDIYDLTGKVIYSSNEYNKNILINTQNWEKGAYIVRISSKNGVKTSKIVK